MALVVNNVRGDCTTDETKHECPENKLFVHRLSILETEGRDKGAVELVHRSFLLFVKSCPSPDHFGPGLHPEVRRLGSSPEDSHRE